MEPNSPNQQQPSSSSSSSSLSLDDDIAYTIQNLIRDHDYNDNDISSFIEPLPIQQQQQQQPCSSSSYVLPSDNDDEDSIAYTLELLRNQDVTIHYQTLLHQGLPRRDSSQGIKKLYSFAHPDIRRTNVHIPSSEKPRVPSSLQELTRKLLDKHPTPHALLANVGIKQKQRLSNLMRPYGEMNFRFLELLLTGFPKHIQLRDCSWLIKDEFLKYFGTLLTFELEVLQLDNCGLIVNDETLSATLLKPTNSLSKLRSLSLTRAVWLSYISLELLVSSAKALRCINLTRCVGLSGYALEILADSYGSTLEELYIDGFVILDAKGTVKSLTRLKKLQVLSLAGIRDLSDDFIKDYIMACGHNIKSLVLKDCVNLTDVSMRFIAGFCSRLNVLDISKLCKLTDFTLGYFKMGFRELRTLKLSENPFSDEAIAAFLKIAGKTLEELSLDSINQVGHQTTLSLAANAINLHTLDLSHCRNLTDYDVGIIVHRCLTLKSLKIVGCTELTGVYLKKYLNSELRIIGLTMTPIWSKIYFQD